MEKEGSGKKDVERKNTVYRLASSLISALTHLLRNVQAPIYWACIVSLAKKEIAKDRYNMVLRRQIGAYNTVTNYFTAPAARLTYDGWGPLVCEGNLRRRVHAQLAGGAQPVFGADPLTTDNEIIYPVVYPYDTAKPVEVVQGTRESETIKLDSIHVKIRANIHESAQNAYTRQIFATFALFRVRKDFTASAAIPTLRQLFALGKFRPWNYSSKIDTIEARLQEGWRVTKLAETSVHFKPDDRYPNTKFTSITWKPKSSVTHEFIPNSNDGDSLKYKYLFAARSNIPNTGQNAVVDCQPTFHAVVFVNYHE